jgi:hypothetical protein
MQILEVVEVIKGAFMDAYDITEEDDIKVRFEGRGEEWIATLSHKNAEALTLSGSGEDIQLALVDLSVKLLQKVSKTKLGIRLSLEGIISRLIADIIRKT